MYEPSQVSRGKIQSLSFYRNFVIELNNLDQDPLTIPDSYDPTTDTLPDRLPNRYTW